MEPYYRVIAAWTLEEAETVMNQMKETGYRVIQVSSWRKSGTDQIIITFERES